MTDTRTSTTNNCKPCSAIYKGFMVLSA